MSGLLLARVREIPPPVPPPEEGFPGGTFVVDPANVTGNASNTNDGLDADDSPWATIAGTLALAPIDSLVYVRGPWAPSSTITLSVLRAGWVTFKPYPGEEDDIILPALVVTLQAFQIWDGFTHNGTISTRTTTSDVKYRNFQGTAISLDGGASESVHRADFEDFELDRTGTTGGTGVNYAADPGDVPPTDIALRRGRLHGVDSGDFIQAKRCGDLLLEDIEATDARRVSSPAAHCDFFQTLSGGDGTATFRRVWIHNEVNNANPGLTTSQKQWTGFQAGDRTGVTIVCENLLLHSIGPTDIEIDSNSDLLVLINCTVLGTVNLRGGSAIVFNSYVGSLSNGGLAGGSVTEDYNVFGSTAYTLGANSATGAVATDLFVDPTNHDYRPKTGSALINAGVASLATYDAPAADIGHDSHWTDIGHLAPGTAPRTRAGDPDIGAYERVAGDP